MTAPLVQAVYPRKTSRGWRVTLVGWNLDMVLAVRLGGLDLIEPSQQTARELVVSVPSTATAGSYPLSLTGLFGELQVSTISVVELVDLDPACPRPYGAEEYTAQAQELLPKGQTWTRRVGTNLWKLLAACSEESARIHQRACDLLMETTPSQSLDSIPDWETELGLPEKCVESLAPSLDARRLEIFRKFNSTGGQAPQYYENLVALLGYKARVEEVYETASPFKAGKSKAGDKLTQGPWFFAWRVVVQIPESNVQSFKAGQNKAGDPLRWWGFQELECFLETLKPSHTILLFSYVLSIEAYMVGDTGEIMVGDDTNFMKGVI